MLVKELCGPSVPGTTHSADLVASFNVLLSPQRGSRLQSAAPFAVFVPATPGLWRHLAGLKVSYSNCKLPVLSTVYIIVVIAPLSIGIVPVVSTCFRGVGVQDSSNERDA